MRTFVGEAAFGDAEALFGPPARAAMGAAPAQVDAAVGWPVRFWWASAVPGSRMIYVAVGSGGVARWWAEPSAGGAWESTWDLATVDERWAASLATVAPPPGRPGSQATFPAATGRAGGVRGSPFDGMATVFRQWFGLLPPDVQHFCSGPFTAGVTPRLAVVDAMQWTQPIVQRLCAVVVGDRAAAVAYAERATTEWAADARDATRAIDARPWSVWATAAWPPGTAPSRQWDATPGWWAFPAAP